MENTPAPLLELKNVTKFFGANKVLDDIDLQVNDGEFLTLLGPSGCGKTTTLRLIAGFERPTTGKIVMGGKEISRVPPNRRAVNMVFQQYALFPHMTSFDNVAFGLKMKGLPKDEIEVEVFSALEKVKMNMFSLRYPSELSSGQQQRIAIARAFVNNPKILLLDEPLSALDYRLRQEMQIELKELQRALGMTFVYVTHDQEEALAMSDRVAVLNEGMVEQVGTPIQIYEEPKNMFVAKFVGEINVFSGMVIKVGENDFDTIVEGMFYRLRKPSSFDVARGSKIKVLLRPEDMVVSKVNDPEAEAPENALRGVISFLVYKGRTIDLWIQTAGGNMVMATQFFNEDDPDIIYAVDDVVNVSWIKDWEVVLPDA
ncbi:MAG TPA: spermidine/putrescine ABC transporter ATP-binding protein PotA [Alphaproteobacteria bacterium]|nr:spermidine/putrescine ABC transporter ATP-binding protein PotA [Alphaproteobacteria bacterium]